MGNGDKNSSNNHNLSFSVEIPDINEMLQQFQDFANEFVKPGIDEFRKEYKDWNSEYNYIFILKTSSKRGDEYIPKNNFSSHSDGSVDL